MRSLRSLLLALTLLPLTGVGHAATGTVQYTSTAIVAGNACSVSQPVWMDLSGGANTGKLYECSVGTWVLRNDVSGAVGSVTSVALSMPAEFSVAGSPITSSGTFTVTEATQTANTVYAGPTSGGATAPDFRSLVAADIPSLSGTYQPLDANLTEIGGLSNIQGDLLYTDATPSWNRLAKDTNATRYLANTGTSNAPQWDRVALTTGVTGTLPIANGGTNATATPTNGGVAYGTGIAYAFSSAGSPGQILRSAGAASPAWSTATYPATASTSGNLLISDGTNFSSVTMGTDATITSAGALTIAANAVALTTDTTGNYVTSVATTSPLSGGAAASEGATLTLSISADGIGPTQIDETANYTWTGTNSFKDTTFEIYDSAGGGAKFKFNPSGSSTMTFAMNVTSDKTVTIQDATQTLVGRDTTDTLTGKTLDVEDTNNFITWVVEESLYMSPQFNGAQENNTNASGATWAPPSGSAQSQSNSWPSLGLLNWSASTDQRVAWVTAFPSTWASSESVDLDLYWRGSGTGVLPSSECTGGSACTGNCNIDWCVNVACSTPGTDSADLGANQETESCPAPELTTYNHRVIKTTFSALDVSGCTAGDLVYVYVSRQGSDATNDDYCGGTSTFQAVFRYRVTQ